MKALYFQDPHISGKNSENRIGDYYSDIMTKIKEILSLSKEHKCDYILCGADIFESPIVSLTICDEFIDLVEKNGIPFYVIAGNHDMFNHSWELSKASTLAHIFRRSKLIKHLDILEGDNYLIQGFDYSHDIEALIRKGQLKLKKPTKKMTIACVHAFITKEPFLPQVSHIPVQEIETDFTMIMVAHNHKPFKKIIDEVTFLNIGCIGRLNIDEADITPSIVIIDTDKRDYKIILLKTAKPKEEIFDIKKVEQLKGFEQDIENFIQSLNTTKFTDLDLMGSIKFIAKEKNIDNEIVEEIVRRLE